MITFPRLVGVPMAVKQTGENQSLNLRLLRFLNFLRVASFVRALGIDIGNKKNILSIRRPERAVGLGSNRGQLMRCRHRPLGVIKIGDPDLRTTLFRRQEQKALTVWSPARPIRFLNMNNLARFATRGRYRPDMR